MKKPILILSILLIAGSFIQAQAQNRVQVIVERANVRLSPDLNSQVIDQVPMGAVLEYTQAEGEWYLVNLPPNAQGFVITGYIHRSVVNVVTETAAPPRQRVRQPPPVPQRTVPPPPPVQPQYRPARQAYAPNLQARLIAGPFVKFGWQHKPDPGGFNYAWMGSLGFDKGISRNFALGIEIMPAYRNYADIDLSILPVKGFVNIKAGESLGRLWSKIGFINFYGGVGAGAQASFVKAEFDGETFTDFDVMFAYHFLFGLEIDIRALRLLVEYQLIQVPDPDVEPNYFGHYIMFGIRF